MTRYFAKGDSTVDATKAEREGFTFNPFEEWFPSIVSQTIQTRGKRLNTTEYLHKRNPSRKA